MPWKAGISASVIYGMGVGGLMFAFVRFVAKAFMRSSETTPPNNAGTPSSLAAIRRAEEQSCCTESSRERIGPSEAGQNHDPWSEERRHVYRRVQDGRRCGARVLSAKGGRDCRPGVLPRQDALWARGAGCPTEPFTGLLLARTPRSEQYRVTSRASRSGATLLWP
jgi:hypothetical protein